MEATVPVPVEFFAPAIGATKVPLGIVGAGTLAARPDGLHLVGKQKGNVLTSALGLLGFVLGFAASLLFDDVSISLRASEMLGLTFAGAALGRALDRDKPFEQVLPWDKLTLDREGNGVVEFATKGMSGKTVHARFTPQHEADRARLVASLRRGALADAA